MAIRDPNLIWNPLSEAQSQAPIVPWQWIVHTAVDAPGPTNLAGYFENHTSLESHTWLRWDRHEQLMDFARRADANYRANRFWYDGAWRGAISTETEDDGRPAETPWNEYQINELVRFGVWLHFRFGIPARLCRHPKDSGMGWHAMWGAPSLWTNAPGKTCPGATRIHQFKTIVLPRIQAEVAAVKSATTVPTVEEIMALNVNLTEHIDRVYAAAPKLNPSDEKGKAYWVGRIGTLEKPEDQRAELSYLHEVGGLDKIT